MATSPSLPTTSWNGITATTKGAAPPTSNRSGPGGSLWRDGVPGGETIEQVGARARRVIETANAADGDVALFAHGHVLRVLAACWLVLPPHAGQLFALGTAAVSVLGYERDDHVIVRWNQDSHLIDVGRE